MKLFFLVALVFALVHASDVEDPDVIVATVDNFDEVLKNEFVLVEFYAPWCGHCKSLAPQYAAAATTLKTSGSAVKLAKVDATVEGSLAEKFGIKGYPTLKFFRSGEPIDYEGGRTANDIVNWVTKKSGPPSKVLASKADVDAYTAASGTRVLAYVSGDNEVAYVNAAKSDKAQAFAFAHVNDASAFGDKKEGTVELHKDGEDVKTFEGAVSTDALLTWVLAEGFPLVDELSQESWTRAQQGQLDLLAIFLNKDSDASAAALEVAKGYKGSLVVTTSEQVGIASRWGSSGNVVPTAIYVHNNGGQPKFTVWNEDSKAEFNAENIKAFVDGSRDGSYDSWMKSEPLPENNDGPVTILVGKNFNDIVHQKKDVLVEFYAPWCGHCQKLSPIYDELGAAYKDDDNIVIAKMDATANGHPKGTNIQGFPTIVFYDANGEQQNYDGERELAAFKSWIDSHRVSKPSAGEKSEL